MNDPLVSGIALIVGLIVSIVLLIRTLRRKHSYGTTFEELEADKAYSHALADAYTNRVGQGMGLTAEQADAGFRRLSHGGNVNPPAPIDCHGCGAPLKIGQMKCVYCRRER